MVTTPLLIELLLFPMLNKLIFFKSAKLDHFFSFLEGDQLGYFCRNSHASSGRNHAFENDVKLLYDSTLNQAFVLQERSQECLNQSWLLAEHVYLQLWGNSRKGIYFFLIQYFIQKKQFLNMNNLCEELSNKHVWEENANKSFSTLSLDQLLDEFLASSPFDDAVLLNVQPTHEHQIAQRANLNISSDIEEIQFQDSSIVLESFRKRLKYSSETQVQQETHETHQEMDQIEMVGQKHHSTPSTEKNRARILKNFLTCLKRNLLLLKMTQFQKINDQAVRSFLMNEKRTNKFEFEKVFKNEEVRAILCVLFSSKILYRQLQHSVISSKNRQIFLKELSLMKKALIEGRLPNL